MRLMLFLSALLPSIAMATGQHHPERFYQEAWCTQAHGRMEYRLPDSTRVDCLTDKYAVEVDYAKKWAEAIGQSLYYALRTGRKPGVVLIMEKSKDVRYLKRLNMVAERYGIRVWQITPQ